MAMYLKINGKVCLDTWRSMSRPFFGLFPRPYVSGHFRPVSKELNEILFFIKRKRVFKTSIFKKAEHAGISF